MKSRKNLENLDGMQVVVHGRYCPKDILRLYEGQLTRVVEIPDDTATLSWKIYEAFVHTVNKEFANELVFYECVVDSWRVLDWDFKARRDSLCIF